MINAKKILNLIADYWAIITAPIMYVATLLALFDLMFDWAPSSMYQHTGIIVVTIIFVFWLVAPAMCKNYRTSRHHDNG